MLELKGGKWVGDRQKRGGILKALVEFEFLK